MAKKSQVNRAPKAETPKAKPYVVDAPEGRDSGVGVQTKKVVLWTHPRMGPCLDVPGRRTMRVTKAEVLRAVNAFFEEIGAETEGSA